MRLIDAVSLESTIQEQTGKCMIKIFEPSVNLILQDIRNAPTIEAEPVKHGHWIQLDRDIAVCSECGRHENALLVDSYPYCHCGAKMDLKDGETK